MTRRRKKLLVVLALILLAAGGFGCNWQAAAVDRQVNVLLAEVRAREPALAGRQRTMLELLTASQSAHELVKLGPSAVLELIRALRDSDSRVRCVAAMALGDLGDARAVEPLIAALKDESVLVRYPAAAALGMLGDARAVEPLIAALKDESGFVRRVAATELGMLGDARAV